MKLPEDKQMKAYLMKCGCGNSGAYRITTRGPAPICGIHQEMETMSPPKDLHDRKASCFYCNTQCESDIALPFFRYQPSAETDQWYCGCFGWD
jgi:hypothetical protein